MFAAHLAPGYFVARYTAPYWHPAWTRRQRVGLWAVALGSTAVADADVIYNALFRGFMNHSTLWTHSIFPYLGLGLLWWVLFTLDCWAYLRMLLGLTVAGGLSHIVLDIIAHSTPMFYPLSLQMIGAPSQRVLEGGVWAYLTDPIFLLEPLLGFFVLLDLIYCFAPVSRKRSLLIGATIIYFLINALFLLALPALQNLAAQHIAS